MRYYEKNMAVLDRILTTTHILKDVYDRAAYQGKSAEPMPSITFNSIKGGGVIDIPVETKDARRIVGINFKESGMNVSTIRIELFVANDKIHKVEICVVTENQVGMQSITSIGEFSPDEYAKWGAKARHRLLEFGKFQVSNTDQLLLTKKGIRSEITGAVDAYLSKLVKERGLVDFSQVPIRSLFIAIRQKLLSYLIDPKPDQLTLNYIVSEPIERTVLTLGMKLSYARSGTAIGEQVDLSLGSGAGSIAGGSVLGLIEVLIKYELLEKKSDGNL